MPRTNSRKLPSALNHTKAMKITTLPRFIHA